MDCDRLLLRPTIPGAKTVVTQGYLVLSNMESKLAPRAEGPARSHLTLHCLALSLEVSQAEFRPCTEGEVEAQRGEFTCPGLHREVTTLLSSPLPGHLPRCQGQDALQTGGSMA